MKKIFIAYIIGIAGLIASLIFDNQIIQAVLGLRFEFLNQIMTAITLDAVVVALVIAGMILLRKKKKSLLFGLNAGIAYVIANLLKWIIMRQRPAVEQIVLENSYSMPSSHAFVLFAMAAIMQKEYPKYLWLWMIIAGVISFSRIYAGVHYLSDVITGAMLGYLTGLFLMWLNKKYKFGIF